MSSTKIIQGTTRSKHMFSSRAFYLQECISCSTDLYASVHQTRTIRSAGLHTLGLGAEVCVQTQQGSPWEMGSCPSQAGQAIYEI